MNTTEWAMASIIVILVCLLWRKHQRLKVLESWNLESQYRQSRIGIDKEKFMSP